jgi:hypothetical protein
MSASLWETMADAARVSVPTVYYRELDDDHLRATTSYGHALILLGVARGRALTKLEDLARMHQNAARPTAAVQSRKGARSR